MNKFDALHDDRTLRWCKYRWIDYNTIVTDETLQKLIKDYISKNFPKEEYSVSIHNECYCESLL